MQFLRPSILSGADKYSATVNDRKGEEKMTLFSNCIEQLDELYIIGYGFVDEHINNRIVRAMHLNQSMTVWTIDPVYIQRSLFSPFDYGLRVRGINSTTTQAIFHMATGSWPDTEDVTKLDSVMEQRRVIYENLYSNVFLRN